MGRGSSKAGGSPGGGNMSPVDRAVIDRKFDVSKQKPTNATQIDNMNEAQLIRELSRAERKEERASNEANQAFNSASAQRMNDVFYQFPGGVGGSAVTPAYRRMVDRGMSQITKGVQAQERAERYSNRQKALAAAYEATKGTGLLVHEAKTARAAVGGKLAGKWTKTDKAFVDNTFGNISGQKNGDFTIGKAWARYYVYRGGKEIGKFDKAADAKKIVEKYASNG